MKQKRPDIFKTPRLLNTPQSRKSSFSILFIFPHLIFIAIVIGLYYYLWQHDLFYNYLDDIYIGVKIVIACDIFIASIGGILAPLIVLIVGLTLLYLGHDYTFSPYSNAWQLLMMSGVGFIIRIVVR
jgi:hypothetical protein